MPGERSEQATQHRREKARKEGDILHSRELTAAAGTLAGVMALGVLGSHCCLLAKRALRISRRWASASGSPTFGPTLGCPPADPLVLCGPALLMAWWPQRPRGLGWRRPGASRCYAGSVGFKLERINPVSNMKNLFSSAPRRDGQIDFAGRAAAVFAVQRIARQLTIPPFLDARLEQLGAEVYGLLLAAAWLLFGWAAVDFLIEWRSRESRLKMSREDLRDEYKETEGNPQIRARIRNLQRQTRRRRVKADVSRAAVVLTNPTHYAVALGFDFVTMEAPK